MITFTVNASLYVGITTTNGVFQENTVKKKKNDTPGNYFQICSLGETVQSNLIT